jgi:hypothetical protein
MFVENMTVNGSTHQNMFIVQEKLFAEMVTTFQCGMSHKKIDGQPHSNITQYCRTIEDTHEHHFEGKYKNGIVVEGSGDTPDYYAFVSHNEGDIHVDARDRTKIFVAKSHVVISLENSSGEIARPY